MFMCVGVCVCYHVGVKDGTNQVDERDPVANQILINLVIIITPSVRGGQGISGRGAREGGAGGVVP